MAQDLATSVKLLTAAIQAISTDRLDQPGTEGPLAALDASFEALRQIRPHLRREITRARVHETTTLPATTRDLLPARGLNRCSSYKYS
jgi:hypothetical protein